MSSNIKVDVDLGGIRKRLREQQQAGRLGQLEKERQARVEQEALAARASADQASRLLFPAPLTKETIDRRGYRPDELAAFRSSGRCPPVYDKLPGGAWVRPIGMIAEPGYYTWLRVYDNLASKTYDKSELGYSFPDSGIYLCNDVTIERPRAEGKGYPLYPSGYPTQWDPAVNPPIGAWEWIGGIEHFNVTRRLVSKWPEDIYGRCGPFVFAEDTVTYEPFATRGQNPPVLDTKAFTFLTIPDASNPDLYNKTFLRGARWGPPTYEFFPYEDAPAKPAKCFFINGVAQYK